LERRKFLEKISYAGAAGLVLSSCESTTSPNLNGNIKADFAIINEAALFEASSIKTYAAAKKVAYLWINQLLILPSHLKHITKSI